MGASQVVQFNTQVCRRCGGTGSHSWNSVDGDRCYGCGGKGKVRTAAAKKAAIALQEWAKEHASVPVTEVKVGDVVLLGSSFRGDKYVEVEKVDHRHDSFGAVTIGGERHETNEVVTLHGKGGTYGQQFHIYAEWPTPTVRRRLTTEEYAQYVEFAGTLSGVKVVTPEPA
jgi:ribosomal protein L40E